MTKILLLGVFHFNPKGDEYIFSEHVQKQLQKLNEVFVKFNPDMIGVEYTAHSQEDIDKSYDIFDLNDLSDIDKMKNQTLGTVNVYGEVCLIRYKNETVQIGYRLGKTLNHEKIYAIDDDTILEDIQSDKMSDIYKQINEKCWQKMKYTGDPNNIIEMFRWANSNEHVYYDNQLYMTINSINAGSTYDGAVFNANWYMRNLKIFANIQKLCETCERLLVIYGSGHLAILRYLIQSCDNMELVSTDEYLRQCVEGR